MIRRLLSFGWKYFVAAVIILVSVGGFGLWLFLRHSAPARTAATIPETTSAPVEDIGPKLAQIEAKRGRLLLVDNDLYELDGGTVIFKSWLSGGMPLKLFYEPDTKTFLAVYEKGLVRYGPDGKQRTALVQKFRLAVSDDYKWLLYVKDKDLWRADLDLKELKAVNEKRLTTIEQFHDSFFAENIVFATDKTLVVRNLNTLLRVDLETGNVKPTRIPLQAGPRKSPDGKCAIGWEGRQLVRYDVDEDDTKSVPIGREGMNGFLWLGNERCVGIGASKAVVLYNRLKNTVSQIAALSGPSQRLEIPSPDGRYVFSAERTGYQLIDLQMKSVVPVTGGAGLFWVSSDTFAFSREIPDTDLRGTWLQTIGEGERRISPEPYLVTKSLTRIEPQMIEVKSAGLIVFVTKHGISRMTPDGTNLNESIALSRLPAHILGIKDWDR